MTTSPSPKRRRWLQFSLRTLLGMTVILGIVPSLIIIERRHCEEGMSDIKAIEAIPPSSLKVTRIEGLDSKRSKWLQAILGNDSFRSVTTIRVPHTGITDDQLRLFQHLKNLEVLDLGGNRISGAGLKPLTRLENLRDLNLFMTEVGDEALEFVGQMKRLEKLRLWKNTNNGLKHLTKLKHLRELELSVDDGGLESVGAIEQLEKLKLRHGRLTNTGSKHLRRLAHLKVLILDYAKLIGDDSLDFCSNSSALEELRLENVDVSDAELAHIGRLSSLKKLMLWHCPRITDEGIKCLSSLTELSDLAIQGAPRISDDAVASLQHLKQMKRLVFHNVPITNKCLPYFQEMPNLEELSLGCNSIHNEGIPDLLKLKNLKSLYLDSDRVSYAGVEFLRKKMPNCGVSNGLRSREIYPPPSVTTTAQKITPNIPKTELPSKSNKSPSALKEEYMPNALSFNGHHYMVFYHEVTWDQAAEECEKLGGHLACLETDEERQKIAQYKGDGQVVWVGGKRNSNGFQWLNGTPITSKVNVVNDSFNYVAYTVASDLAARPLDGKSDLFTLRFVLGFVCEWDD